MSGKFVPAGALDQVTDRDHEWLQARQELEAKQKERESKNHEHDGKTLFEVLQANKAAKEEAFQESIKLKNQFRALNDDEVEFLDSQAEAARAKELAVRKETSEQLEVFRQKQDAASKANPGLLVGEKDQPDDAIPEIDANWTTSKKRKKSKQKEPMKGVKLPRSSSEVLSKSDDSQVVTELPKTVQEEMPVKVEAQRTGSHDTKNIAPRKQGLAGLVSYGSDEESDVDF